ncbi:MAG: tryptophan/tyrosine permease [Coxiellaceae bacterium]|nr:MAG: tryptophan/tyrosine permease [Coxiellaceae bacterium]
MNDAKLIGGILLIVGTAIGGGMLALPVATAQMGFINSSIFLLVSWLIMTVSALLILEVNLWLPRNSNIISMAKATLGKYGALTAWIFYLLLFYSLVTAYIAGGGDFLHTLLSGLNIHLSNWTSSLLFSLVLGFIVYKGIQTVDYVNRGLMFGKLAAYLVLVAIVLFFISPAKLSGGHMKYITTSVTVMVTSFGFANIIPSLRSYFNDDVHKLRRAVIIGSLIPLTCYIIWDLAIMGVIGNNHLIDMLKSGHSTGMMVSTLSDIINNSYITLLVKIFTSICLATSFLGVSLSLSDFLSDGLKVPKAGKGNLIIYAATFLPPIAIVLVYPAIFIKALSYAGIYCMVLLVILPALMTWQGRYRKQLADGPEQVAGGKLMLILLMVSAILIAISGLLENLYS